jgi:hypothetical protein
LFSVFLIPLKKSLNPSGISGMLAKGLLCGHPLHFSGKKNHTLQFFPQLVRGFGGMCLPP